ncbi:hypothetical protein BCON_0405g00120 [Botryotinia convoluta]|uniref:Uncharacterized protein n=1 Tax=Botryotinia convoluta TaxID=54673 RepID=A0A4Z1HJW8_9HELO|nr:hypothetical protein BCON_0405g00120 [Botryotinia convoluta]
MTAMNLHECLITVGKQRAIHRSCRLRATVPANLMQKFVPYSSFEFSDSVQLINYPRVDDTRLSIKVLHKTYAATVMVSYETIEVIDKAPDGTSPKRLSQLDTKAHFPTGQETYVVQINRLLRVKLIE